MRPLMLIAIPLALRHLHHLWSTRHAERRWSREGWVSVVVWLGCYLTLLVGAGLHEFRAPLDTSFWIGYGLLWLGALGRMRSIRELGAAFSECIRVTEDQPLVDTGIYAYVRHPLHYFLMIEMIAMAWWIHRPWGWSVIGVAIVTLLFRERHEEEALIRAYGDRYIEYRRRTVALVDLLKKRGDSNVRKGA